MVDENLGALETLFFGLRVVGAEDLGAQIATPAD